MKYLSLEDILRLHYLLVEDFGGMHGVRDEGRLKSVVEVPQAQLFGRSNTSLFMKKRRCMHAAS
jgi:death on curing protein